MSFWMARTKKTAEAAKRGATSKAPSPKTAKKPPKNAASEPRRRLSREDALELIFDATEKRLREHGPDAIRIQEIAEDVGMSHPTVLHHVGSREELLQEVCSRALLTLETELIEVFSSQEGRPEIAPTLHRIDEVLRGRGQARLIAWLTLTQPSEEGNAKSRLADVIKALHAARAADAPRASFEDTAFAVLLASSAMVGASLLGPGLFAMAGLPSGEPTLKKFREWFAALMVDHAERVDGAPRKP